MVTKKRILVYLMVLAILAISAVAIGVKHGESSIEIVAANDISKAVTVEDNSVQEVPTSTKFKLDFKVTSKGKGNLSNFNINVWTTDGRNINLGEFGFTLRQIEEIHPHESRIENFIDYQIPVRWNSSQVLQETVKVVETARDPVRAKIANEPLFRRGNDYPSSIPFDEIEIQVDLVNYYIDADETEYIAWLRIEETEKGFDIKKVFIEGYTEQNKTK